MGEQAVGKTVITEDVEIVGTIKASGALRIDGKLNGDLNCSSDVVLGQSASIKGNLSVNCISVEGHVNGNIVAKDRIELKSAARINGDVRAKRLTVEDGVSLVGKAEVNPSGVNASRAVVDSTPGKDAPAEEDAGESAPPAAAGNKGGTMFSKR